MVPGELRNISYFSYPGKTSLFFRVYYFTAVRNFPFFGAAEDSFTNAKYKTIMEICKIIQERGRKKCLRGY